MGLLGVTQSTSPFFALHHHHGPRLHLPDCTSLEPVSTLEAPLRQSSDSRAEWLTTHQPQVMSPSRLLFKTCIDVSSEYRPINFAVRRENFDIKDDWKFAVSEDSEHVPQQAVGSRCSVASTVAALMNVDSVSSTGKPSHGYKSIMGSCSSTVKPVQCDGSFTSTGKPVRSGDSVESVERNM